MQGSGNSSRQRESGETSFWVALILWKWSWVTGMTQPLSQVKSWGYSGTLWLHLVKTKTEEMDQWSRWWKPECTDWMSPMSLCLLSIRPGHGFHSLLYIGTLGSRAFHLCHHPPCIHHFLCIHLKKHSEHQNSFVLENYKSLPRESFNL